MRRPNEKGARPQGRWLPYDLRRPANREHRPVWDVEIEVSHPLRALRYSEEAVELTVRRVFQALRIAVNDEFFALDALLRQFTLEML